MVVPMKAYSYARVSGKSQVEGDGFTRQAAAIDAWAAVNGAEVVQEFQEEGVGGDNEWQDRPAFSDMIGLVLDNGVRTIVVENLGRLARAYVVQEHILIWFASKGITLISADSGEDITAAIQADPMKKLLIQMQGILFEFEKNSLVRKLKAARQRKQESDPDWSQGRKPFGAREGEPETLERMQELRDEGLGYKRIATALNTEKRGSRSGKPWRPESVRRILTREKNHEQI